MRADRVTDDAPTSSAARVLIALLRVEVRDDRATVRSVGREAERSASTVFASLEQLERFGLVTQTPGAHATLRSTVAVVVGPWSPR